MNFYSVQYLKLKINSGVLIIIKIIKLTQVPVLYACLFVSSYALDQDLEFQVVGEISERCELNVLIPNGAYIDPMQDGANSANLEIDCNTPMLLHVTSANGGLLASDQSIDNSLDSYEYDVSIRIQSLGLDVQTSSQVLKQSVIYSSNSTIPFATQGEFELTLRQPLMYAGNYEDVLYFDIKPNLDIGIR